MIPAPLGHFAYRVANLGLRLWSLLLRPHTRGVKCLVCTGDEILLVRHSYGRRVWDLPGGFVRRDEPYDAAARRELHEELALGEGPLTDLGELERDHLGRHERIRIFRLDIPARAGEIQGFELLRIAWFARDDLPDRRAKLVDEILDRDRRFVA